MILSDENLEALTHRKQSAAQAKVLSAMGVDFRRRPDGSVIVSVAVVENFLGVASNAKLKVKEPNWEALTNAKKKK